MASNLPNISAKSTRQEQGKDVTSTSPDVLLNGGAKLPKPSDDQSRLNVPLQHGFRSSIDTFSDLSIYSADNENERGTRHSLLPNRMRIPSRSPAPEKASEGGRWDAFWLRNKGILLVLLAQLFGSLMNVATRLLETDDANGIAMDPFQILFARMSITSVMCLIYMWWARVPHAPFGAREVRTLLVARGLGGFFGVYGLYYSLLYLPLGEAVVITFLAPLVASWACSILVKEPFTRIEQIAGLVSLFGVVLIAQPFSFLNDHSTTPFPLEAPTAATNGTVILAISHPIDDVTTLQRWIAIGVALLGVVGAACAYTTIRWIGHRAHPLISVNYFGTWCTIVSTVALVAIPGVTFRLPATLREWGLLTFLGSCGFFMQFLLTAGLSHEKSSRTNNILYTGMLFALFFDKVVWNKTPGLMSIAGSSLILGSTIYVTVKIQGTRQTELIREGTADEEAGLVASTDEDEAETQEVSDTEPRSDLPGDVQEYQMRTLR